MHLVFKKKILYLKILILLALYIISNIKKDRKLFFYKS